MAELALSVAFLWFVSHPEQLDELTEKLQAWFDQTRYRASVWQALRAIRNLPERPENGS